MITLVVDVGATAIKWQYFENEESLGVPRRRRTPSPCHPDELVDIIATRAIRASVSAVAVGFPGDVVEGVITDPANLARVGGPGSAIDEVIARAWRAFNLTSALTLACGAPALVVNDAVATAAGCDISTGRHLVITLGTGLGVALAVDGELVPIDDVGGTVFGSTTFDEAAGETARAANPEQWIRDVIAILIQLREVFDAGVIHVAGGNAKRLSSREFSWLNMPVVIERSLPALEGLRWLTLGRPPT